MKKIVLILLAFMFTNSYSQNNNSGIDICIALKDFNSNSEAERALDKILSAIGASKNFVMQECSNVSNASALQVEGVRYIFYNPQWMKSINNSTSYGGLFTLAHEVGHHINGHALDWVLIASKTVNPKTLSERREQELEADEFAGFVMAKLGASLNESSEVINNISNNSDDSYSTHPARYKRLAAIKKGYDKGKNNNDSNYASENNSKNRNINNEVVLLTNGGRWEGEVLTIPASSSLVSIEGKAYVETIPESKKPNGFGVLYQTDGSVYKGAHYGGYKNGYGEMLYTDGSKYKGQWLNGNKSGRGELIKPDGAIITVINGVSKEEIEAEKYFELGDAKATSEDYEGAIASFTKAIEINPNYAQAYWNRADANLILGNYKSTIFDCNKAFEYEKNKVVDDYIFNLRGTAKFYINDYLGSIEDLEKSLELTQINNVLEYKNEDKRNGLIGICYFKLNKHSNALVYLNKAIDLDPNDVYTLYFRGACKYKLEDYVGAIEDYTKAIELDPNDADTYFQRGASKYDFNDFDGAVLDFTKAISIEPNNFEYYKYRGSAKFYSKPADYKGAIDDYTMALKINPNDIFCLSERGRSKHDIGDYSGAILDYTKAIVIDSNHINSYITRGSSKNNSKDYAGAIADYNKAIEINPNNPLPYYNRAIAKENIKDYNGACSDLRKAKDLGKDFDDEDKLMLNKVCK
jgi:tetratricopeptide (TPR) repeat protein